jgi:hypothetical protein
VKVPWSARAAACPAPSPPAARGVLDPAPAFLQRKTPARGVTAMTPEEILARHARAAERRRPLEATWQACYDHALPPPGAAPLFDATAADAAESLAASLLAELAPPWSRWFGLAPTRALEEGPDAQRLSAALEDAAAVLQGHLDRSNFALELHQAFLDLVVAGTGLLLVEEAPAGEPSVLRFRAVPLREAVMEEGASGRLDTVFRSLRLTPAEIRARWPDAPLPAPKRNEDPPRLRIVEAAWPDPRGGHLFAAVMSPTPARPSRSPPAASRRTRSSPSAG